MVCSRYVGAVMLAVVPTAPAGLTVWFVSLVSCLLVPPAQCPLRLALLPP